MLVFTCEAKRQMLVSFYQTTQQIQFAFPTMYVLLLSHTPKIKICPTSFSTTTLQTWLKNYGNPISNLGDKEYRLTTSTLHFHFMQPVQRTDKRSFTVSNHYALLPWQLRASRVLMFSRQTTCLHTYNCREY